MTEKVRTIEMRRERTLHSAMGVDTTRGPPPVPGLLLAPAAREGERYEKEGTREQSHLFSSSSPTLCSPRIGQTKILDPEFRFSKCTLVAVSQSWFITLSTIIMIKKSVTKFP
jgi:hypothetical protein